MSGPWDQKMSAGRGFTSATYDLSALKHFAL